MFKLRKHMVKLFTLCLMKISGDIALFPSVLPVITEIFFETNVNYFCVPYLSELEILLLVFLSALVPLYVSSNSEVEWSASDACQVTPWQFDPPKRRDHLELWIDLEKIFSVYFIFEICNLLFCPSLNLIQFPEWHFHLSKKFQLHYFQQQVDHIHFPGPHHQCTASETEWGSLHGTEEVASWPLFCKNPPDSPATDVIMNMVPTKENESDP